MEQYAALSDEITVEYLMEEALCDWAADIDYLDPTEAGYQALEEVVARGLNNAKAAAQRYSIDPDFKAYIDLWNREGRPEDWAFIVGTTSNVIQGLGVMEQDIYMLSEKINKIFEDHPEMTLAQIKKIPEILEDPVLILASRNVSNKGQKRKTNNSRIIVIGDAKATNNLPVMNALDLRPIENRLLVEGFQKVASAYTKDNELKKRLHFFENSDVLYVDKKRTAKLLETIGFSMPIELQLSGYAGSISYFKQDVNIKGTPFKKVFKYSIAGRNAATADQAKLAEARELEVNGYTPGEIYRETGWFRGADRKWRFEIDDSTMRYYKGGDAQFRKMPPGYVRHQELTTKMLDGTITEEEYQELRDSIWHREYRRITK